MLIFTCLMEKTISEWLAEAIKASGLSQAELSRKSGVSAPHITKVLNGERGLGEMSLRAIAEALKIPPEEAFRAAGFLPPVAPNTEQHERLIYLFNKLDQSKRDDLLFYAEFLLKK